MAICDPKVTTESINKDLADFSKNLYEVQSDPYKAAKDAHAIVILTDWEIFRNLDYQRLYDSMKKPAFVFDGRNLLNLAQIRNIGFEAYGIGKPRK